MSETQTPRTEQAVDDANWTHGTWVKADFARQLERELAEATAQRDALAEALREVISGYDVVTETASICADYIYNVVDPTLAALKGDKP